MDVTGNAKSLPENAYRKLKPGEQYVPVVPAEKIVPELTPYALFWGLFYAVLFSGASAYLGLKIGQVFEAAIPITILAIGLSNSLRMKNSLQQNVMVQSIGSASGVVVAGAIFTVPGLYILGLADQAGFFRIFMASLLGGFLGILFLIPFRRYFVKDMHGEFPFPEATASTEVLMAGEAGGEQAKVLIQAGSVAGVYQLLSQTFHVWGEQFSTYSFGWGRKLADATRLEFRMLVEAAVVGLGYIVGLRYALIIASGSFLAWWVMTPMFGILGKGIRIEVADGEYEIFRMDGIAGLPPEDIFYNFVRPVGIGAIASNIMGRRIIRAWEDIVGRIPVMRWIYRTSKQLFSSLLEERSSSFRKVVLVPYPHPGTYSIAFVTSDSPTSVLGALGPGFVTVFLPTTPNPTSGLLLVVPVSEIVPLDISVEDGLKLVISAGALAKDDE